MAERYQNLTIPFVDTGKREDSSLQEISNKLNDLSPNNLKVILAISGGLRYAFKGYEW